MHDCVHLTSLLGVLATVTVTYRLLSRTNHYCIEWPGPFIGWLELQRATGLGDIKHQKPESRNLTEWHQVIITFLCCSQLSFDTRADGRNTTDRMNVCAGVVRVSGWTRADVRSADVVRLHVDLVVVLLRCPFVRCPFISPFADSLADRLYLYMYM